MNSFIKSFLTTVSALLLSASAFAYSGGNGSELFPYLISSKADMEELATNVNGGQQYAGMYFQLTRDLTGGSDTITTIIGSSSTNSFRGIFDGGGYEIAVKISGTGNYMGLFGRIQNATIKNLGVSGISTNNAVTNAIYGAGIAGYATSSNIINCYNKASISLSGSFSGTTTYSFNAGGICGYSDGCTITDCYNTGTVSASITNTSTSNYVANAYVGGICGYATGTLTVTNCYNTGNVFAAATKSGTSSTTNYAVAYTGGVCGYFSASSKNINNSYNTGNVTSTGTSGNYALSNAGGICGFASSAVNNKISNAYNTGNVSATASGTSIPYSAGICAVSATVENCFVGDCQISNVNDAPRTQIGRVGGADGTYTNNHAYGMIMMNGNAISQSSATHKDGKDALTAWFQDQAWLETNLSWDFDDVWEVATGNYPTLKLPAPDGGEPPVSPNVTVAVSSNNALGATLGSGTYLRNASVTIYALPLANNVFVNWSDSNTDNPRTITADDNITLTATFAACDNSALLAQIAALEADTAALNSQNAALNSQNAILQNDLTTCGTEKTNLQNDLDIANGAISDLESDLSTCGTDKTNLQNDLDTANGIISGLESDLSTCGTEKTNLQNDLDTANGTISGLESDLSTCGTEKTNLQNDLNVANDAITTLNSTIAALEADTVALHAIIIGLESDLSDAEAEIIRLLSELDECGTSVGAMPAKSASTLSVYPNPTQGVVYFNGENRVKVYTQNGALLQEKTGDSVDLSGYPTATYLLQIGTEWVKVVKK